MDETVRLSVCLSVYPTFASPMQDIYWCSYAVFFLGNQNTLSLELAVTDIVSHIVMLCVCKWTVSGGCVLNF